MDTLRILSIDGGGIRGIIPATVLAELERRTQKPAWQLFDLIAGTSTGGILALGLVKPGTADGSCAFSAAQLVDVYREGGPTIFHRSAWHRVTSLGNLLEEKYDAHGIETVLDQYFDEARLSSALTDVLITSYEIERRLPFFFRSARAKTNVDYDFPMKEVARATSAAPTYFEPERIAASSDYYALIDGGVFANNPGMCAFVEARTEHPEATDIVMLSLGTGELTRRLPYDEVKSWGLAQWAQPLLGVVFDGVSDTVNYQLQQLCKDLQSPEQRYFRLQTELIEGNDDMDDASRTNMRVLGLRAEALIADHDRDLDAVAAILTA